MHTQNNIVRTLLSRLWLRLARASAGHQAEAEAEDEAEAEAEAEADSEKIQHIVHFQKASCC